MAVIAVTALEITDNFLAATFAAGTSADTSRPIDVSRYNLIGVQHLSGTIGTTVVQGSMDGTNWGALGAGLTVGAANVVTTMEVAVRFVRINYGAAAAGAVVALQAVGNN